MNTPTQNQAGDLPTPSIESVCQWMSKRMEGEHNASTNYSMCRRKLEDLFARKDSQLAEAKAEVERLKGCEAQLVMERDAYHDERDAAKED